MKKSKDVITGFILAVLAVFYLTASFSIKVFEGVGKTVINAGTIPRFWGICLLLLSLMLIWRGLKRQKQQVEVSGRTSVTVKAWLISNHAVYLTFTLLILYISLIGKLGYLVTTTIYLTLQMLLLSPGGEKKPLIALGLSVVTALFTYYLFVHLLHVPLPAGLLAI